MSFGIGIVGCGLIGRKRAAALGEGRLIACADLNIERARKLAADFNASSTNNWKDVVASDKVDILIIATLHDSLAEITKFALENNKHVLVEKPAARNAKELEPILELGKDSNVKVHVGFNHRYHRSLQKAYEIVQSGQLGDLMFVRARYGHGARPGYDREWRADPKLSGGGELIDQGTHLIDLSRWFLGEFTEVEGYSNTYYWDMPVDDNSFMILKTPQKQVAFLHASCTEWKNMFSMEIYGKYGKLDVNGLGGSYGVERLTHYNMLPEMGPPETTSWEYPMGDNSWAVEIEEFYEDIRLDRVPSSNLFDAYEALKIVQLLYKKSGYDHSA